MRPKALPFIVGRGPVPRRASVCTGNGLGRRVVFAQVERRGGQAPALRFARPPRFTVGRGPVPRQAIGYMRDRGGQAPALREKTTRHRRARACPSPSSASSNARGGNPLGCACGIRGPPRYGTIKTGRSLLPERNRKQLHFYGISAILYPITNRNR